MNRLLLQGLAVLVGIVAVGVAAVTGLSWVGATRWAEATATLHRQLDAAQVKPAAPRHFSASASARDLADLPAPVQRYLRAALTDGQRQGR